MAKRHDQMKSLAEQIADLEDPTPKDFDPEDLNDGEESGDNQSSGTEDGNANAGREHYVAVGKSKLRKPERISLGREYAGSRVSREALEGDGSEDDTFRKDTSDEVMSESADELDESENGRVGEDSSDAESEDMDHGLRSGGELDGVTDSEDDQEFGDSNDDETSAPAASDDRAEIRRLMASDHKTVATSLSQAVKADAAKGSAIKRQRSAFGAILNARIKLQRGITILNELDSHPSKRTMTDKVQQLKQPNGTAGASHELNEVYNDSSFYQALLRDLVEERMSANSGVEALQMQLPSRLATHPTTGMRKDKVKRSVDTKASKGRKMRYTVHEKLQNFMPPEDRGTWGDRAREEFFASLLGRSARAVLGEDDEDEDKVMDDEEDIEEDGLRLFRS
ncbi:bfr2 [Histoplasma capsulatum H143]|uniref:Bfr2 n=1 Tax=Ajellomyces capsulatus (strain H143) TaxID=544712 RepID=C6HD85_AJECH|nr:bfr2 [Histoplasma capsulatum H143]